MATPGVKDGSGVLHNRWVMLAVLTTARLALGFQFQSVGSTAPFLVANLCIDYATVGFLMGLYLLPGVVVALPGRVFESALRRQAGGSHWPAADVHCRHPGRCERQL